MTDIEDFSMTLPTSGPSIPHWKTLKRDVILEHSKFLTVESHRIALPDGRIIEDWPWIIIPSASIVLAETLREKFLCFRQYKYAVGDTLAPVGGMIESDEEPLLAAQRELLEETGYEANEWIHLGSYPMDPNRGIAIMHLYLARGARYVGGEVDDDLEEQHLLQLSRTELEAALMNGEFKVQMWAANIALALLYLNAQMKS
jgi:ADP-ribose pyrophosphatase